MASSPETPSLGSEDPASAGIVGRLSETRLDGDGRRRARGRSRIAVAGGWLILLLAAAAVGAFFFFRLEGTAQAASSGTGQTTGDVAQGAALFQQSCAQCHGPQGQGVIESNGAVRGINIQSVGAAAVDFVLRTGRMPLAVPVEEMVREKPAFTPQEIRDIVAYTSTFIRGPGIPQVSVTGANLSKGRALFTQNCAACHAPSGAGDAIGGGYTAPSLQQATPLDVAEAMRVGPIPMPRFNSSAFSQQDVNDVAAYVQYLQASATPGGLSMGEVGPVPEGFMAFVVGVTAVYLIIRFIARPGRRQRADARAHSGVDEPAR